MADFEETISFDGEGFDQMAAEMAAAMGKGAQAFARDFFKKFSSQAKNAGQSGFGKNFGKGAEDLFDRLNRSASNFEKRLRAMSNLAGKIDVDPDSFLVANRTLQSVVETAERLQRELQGGNINQNRFNQELKTAAGFQKALYNDTVQLQSALRNLNTTRAIDSREQISNARLASDAERRASAERIVAAQTSNARIVAETRAANQRRVEHFRAAVNQIRALERGLAAIFRGTASAISASFRGIGRTISASLSSALSRQGSALGGAGISGALGRRESVMRSSFSRQERIVSSSVQRQSAQIQRLETRLSSGVLGAASGRSAAGGLFGGGLLAGAAGGAGLTALLTQGFGRFSELERLNKQFEALTQNQEASVKLMDELKQFAKTTSFDLVGVADLAKGFLAMGTATEDVLPRVRTIADAVALTGGGVDELNRIQRALGQVVSAGRLQGDELNQLAENLPGLNIRKIIADQLTGGDTAALIKMQEAGDLSADAFMGALLAGLSGDPRLEGAAEDLAETVGGRFANLKESFADLGATLIGTIAGQLRVAFKVLNDVFAGLSQFIRGEELSQGLELLRTAAKGAAAALGALAAAKIGGEALQFLGVALRGLLTPLGLVVAATAGVGAFFALLRERSPAFNEQMQRLGTIVGNAFEKVREFFGGIGQAVADFLGGPGSNLLAEIGDVLAGVVQRINNVLAPFVNTVLGPALSKFADIIKNVVYPAIVNFLGDAAYFIVGTVIPNLKKFYTFVSGTLVPFLVDKVVGAFNFVKDAITELDFGKLAKLGGVIAAAIAGFAVGGPIGGAVAGGAAAIGLLFSDTLGKSILGGLGDLAGMIGDALEGPFNAAKATVSNFFANIFTTDNLLNVSGKVLDVIERIGFTITNVLTDPRLVAALATFVGLAVAAAARFVEGLIRGIADNLPGLYDLFKTAGGEAVKFLLEGLTSADFLTTAIPALLVGASLLGAWRTAGQRAGLAAGQGFLGSFKTNAFGGALAGGGTLTKGGGAGAFLTTALFGAGGIEGAEARIKAQATRLTNTMARTLQMAGRSIQQQPGEGFPAAVKRQFDQLITEIGPSGAVGLRFRTALKNLFSGNFRQFAADAQISGRAIGRSLVTGLAGGVAGFQIGKAIAESGGSGFDQLLGVGGTALAIGAISGPAGIAAAAMGTLGIAMGNMAREAKESKGRVEELAAAILALDENAAGVGEALMSQLQAGVREGGITKLLDEGFNVADFTKRVTEGTTSLRQEIEKMTGPLKDGFANTQGFMIALMDLGFSGGEARDVIEFLGQSIKEYDKGVGAAANTEILRAQLAGVGQDAARAESGFKSLAEEADAFNTILSRLSTRDRNAALAPSPELASDLRNQREALEEIETAAENARRAVEDFLTSDYQNTLQSELDNFTLSLSGIADSLQFEPGTAQQVIDAATRGIGDDIRLDLKAIVSVGVTEGQITTIQGATDLLNSLKTQIGDIFLAEGEPDANGNPTIDAGEYTAMATIFAQIDSLTLDTEALNELLKGAIPVEPPEIDVPFFVNPVPQLGRSAGAGGGAGSRNQAAALGLPGSTFGNGSELFSDLFGSDPIAVNLPVTVTPVVTVNQGSIAAIGGQIANAIAQGLLGAAAIISIAAIAAVNTAVAAAAAGAAGASAVGTKISSGIAGGVQSSASLVSVMAALVVNSAVVTATSAAAAGSRAGAALAQAVARGIQSGQGAAVGAARALGAAASAAVSTSTTAAQQAGVNLAQGLANGIRAGQSAAVNAARAMATAVANAARAALAIKSPSLVFADIGQQIGLGLAQGIADSEEDLNAVVDNVIGGVIKKASGLAGTTSYAAAQIFEKNLPSLLAGGVSNLDVLMQEIGLSTLPQQLAKVFEDAKTASLAVTGAGAANAQAFIQFGQSIREFGTLALASGRDVGSVVEQMRAYREQLLFVTIASGGMASEAQALVDALGLTDEQLDAFVQQVMAMTEAMGTPMTAAAKEAIEAIEGVSDAAEGGGESLGESLASGIASTGDAAAGAARTLSEEAATAIKGTGADMTAAGYNLASGLAQGIRDGSGLVGTAARDMARSVVDTVHQILQISSPSRVFYDIGIAAGEGFAEGMRGAEASMVSAASRAVSAAMEAAQIAAGQPRGSLLSGIFEALQVGTKRVADLTLQRTLAGLGGLTGQLQELLGDLAKKSEATRSIIGMTIEEVQAAGRSGEINFSTMTVAWSTQLGRQVLVPINEVSYGYQGTPVHHGTWVELPGWGPVWGGMAPGTGATGPTPIDMTAFTNIADDIRQFIIENLDAGVDMETVLAHARSARDALINESITQGLDISAITAVFDRLGLSESALNEFIEAVRTATGVIETNTEAKKAEAIAEDNKDRRPVEVNVYPQYGDPEAIGLGVVNQLALRLTPF